MCKKIILRCVISQEAMHIQRAKSTARPATHAGQRGHWPRANNAQRDKDFPTISAHFYSHLHLVPEISGKKRNRTLTHALTCSQKGQDISIPAHANIPTLLLVYRYRQTRPRWHLAVCCPCLIMQTHLCGFRGRGRAWQGLQVSR